MRPPLLAVLCCGVLWTQGAPGYVISRRLSPGQRELTSAEATGESSESENWYDVASASEEEAEQEGVDSVRAGLQRLRAEKMILLELYYLVKVLRAYRRPWTPASSPLLEQTVARLMQDDLLERLEHTLRLDKRLRVLQLIGTYENSAQERLANDERLLLPVLVRTLRKVLTLKHLGGGLQINDKDDVIGGLQRGKQRQWRELCDALEETLVLTRPVSVPSGGFQVDSVGNPWSVNPWPEEVGHPEGYQWADVLEGGHTKVPLGWSDASNAEWDNQQPLEHLNEVPDLDGLVGDQYEVHDGDNIPPDMTLASVYDHDHHLDGGVVDEESGSVPPIGEDMVLQSVLDHGHSLRELASKVKEEKAPEVDIRIGSDDERKPDESLDPSAAVAPTEDIGPLINNEDEDEFAWLYENLPEVDGGDESVTTESSSSSTEPTAEQQFELDAQAAGLTADLEGQDQTAVGSGEDEPKHIDESRRSRPNQQVPVVIIQQPALQTPAPVTVRVPVRVPVHVPVEVPVRVPVPVRPISNFSPVPVRGSSGAAARRLIAVELDKFLLLVEELSEVNGLAREFDRSDRLRMIGWVEEDYSPTTGLDQRYFIDALTKMLKRKELRRGYNRVLQTLDYLQSQLDSRESTRAEDDYFARNYGTGSSDGDGDGADSPPAPVTENGIDPRMQPPGNEEGETEEPSATLEPDTARIADDLPKEEDLKSKDDDS
ncbi:uncharacterized protein LOC128277440 [Anopheles cruzii]|uniref:uncharacterized protein LOC128277440 n=1 Tax=Anopheles cruzii TaxID=68878 RepID=UPI0022EC7CA2|nr:uncharacterized protein LOC128277440 [Anopheles cruzii]